MNIAVLIGRLTKDPELRYTNSQMPVCQATLAVDRPISKNSQSEGNDRQADFIRIALFGKQAETFSRYLTKGRQVAVEGRIQTGSYQNQKGDTVYTTNVIVNRFDFIGNGGNSQPVGGNLKNTVMSQQGGQIQPEIPEGFEAIDDDDIPF